MQQSDYTLDQLNATILNMKDGGKVAKIKMDFGQLVAGGLSDTNNTPIATVRNLINDGYTLMIEDVSINTRRAIAVNTDDGMQILFNSGMYLLPHVRESMITSWTEIEIEHVSIIKDPLSKNGGDMNTGAELNFYSDSDHGEGTKTFIKPGRIEVVGEDVDNKSTITPTRVESKNLEAENVQGENLQLRNNSDKTASFEVIIEFFEDLLEGKIEVENFLGTNLKVKGDDEKSTSILDIYKFFKALNEGKIEIDNFLGTNLKVKGDDGKSTSILDIYNFFKALSDGKIEATNLLGTNLKVKGDESKSAGVGDICDFFKDLGEGKVSADKLIGDDLIGLNLKLKSDTSKSALVSDIITFFNRLAEGLIRATNLRGTNLQTGSDEDVRSIGILDIIGVIKQIATDKNLYITHGIEDDGDERCIHLTPLGLTVRFDDDSTSITGQSVETPELKANDLKGFNLVSRNDITKSISIDDIIRVVSIMAGNSNNSLKLIRHIDSDDDAYLELTPDHVKLENERSDTRTTVEAGKATFRDDEDYVEIVGSTFKSVYRDSNDAVHSTVIRGGSIQCEQIGLPGGNTLDISALQTIMSAFADGRIEFRVNASATPGMYYSMTLDANGIAFSAPRGGASTSIGSGGFNGPSIQAIGITATTLAPTDDSTSSINISDLISTVRRLMDGFIDRNITINGNLSLKNIEGTTADFNTLKVGGTAGISTSVKVGEKTLYFNNGLLTSVS